MALSGADGGATNVGRLWRDRGRGKWIGRARRMAGARSLSPVQAPAMLASVILTSAMLAGCSMTSSHVSDNLLPGDLRRSHKAVAFLMMGVRGEACPLARIGLGRRSKDGFRQTNVLLIRHNWWDRGGIPQIELAPGTYHVISWVCETGRYARSIGRKSRQFFSLGTTYLKSYAAFSVNAGEVVNVGYLRMVNLGGMEFVRFDVADLPPRAHAWLRRQYPRLYAQMITRLMRAGQSSAAPSSTPLPPAPPLSTPPRFN